MNHCLCGQKKKSSVLKTHIILRNESCLCVSVSGINVSGIIIYCTLRGYHNIDSNSGNKTTIVNMELILHLYRK